MFRVDPSGQSAAGKWVTAPNRLAVSSLSPSKADSPLAAFLVTRILVHAVVKPKLASTNAETKSLFILNANWFVSNFVANKPNFNHLGMPRCLTTPKPYR